MDILRVYSFGIRMPPSKRTDSAFMIGDSTRNLTRAANSLGTPNRSVGKTWAFFRLSPMRDAGPGLSNAAVRGVAMMPGHIVLMRTPRGPKSRAIGRAIPTTPALDAEYAAWPFCPSKAATDATLMMVPRSPFSSGAFLHIHAAHLDNTENVPMRFSRMMNSKLSIGCALPLRDTVDRPMPTPAQFTHPSMRPHCAPAAAMAFVTDSSFVASMCTKTALPAGKLATTAFALSSCTSSTTTLPPFAVSMRHAPSPSPEAPPVTQNTRS
mmetsp:Transcript_18265/g.42772  ORF Transcript_18265/g.42772 Transcript_18265/m.42772 type:complete len:267 (+) Transcript_18265:90-890(+)